MRNLFRGLRGRVTFTVLVVTAALYSVVGTVGFIAISNNGRESIRERVNEVLDQLEWDIRREGRAVTLSTNDGVRAYIVANDDIPPEANGLVQITRQLQIENQQVTIVGRTSDVRLTESLQSLFRAMWIAIPLAAIVSALMAGFATRRALRPVGLITARASSIDTPTAGARVPVPDTDDEITQLALTLNSMLDRVDVAHIAQRQFTSDAAHELRTPLMALQGELELLSNGTQSADTHTITRLVSLSSRLGERIDDLLLLSTLDEGRPLDIQDVELLVLTREVMMEVAPQAENVGDPIHVRIDRRLIARALRNLLGNAVRHSDGRVRLSLEQNDDEICIHVEDNGPGVLEDEIERIFGRFTRLDTSRDSSAGGAGLGLSIVAAIVSAHGGRIDVTRSDLGGAKFTIWLPAVTTKLD